LAVLDAIKNEGNTIDEIYYRGNGVININYGHMTETKSYSGEYLYDHSYKNLLYRDGSVTDIPVDWGYHPRYYDSEEELPSGGPGRYLASYNAQHFGFDVDTVYPTSFP
jgi:hypothetical protein